MTFTSNPDFLEQLTRRQLRGPAQPNLVAEPAEPKSDVEVSGPAPIPEDTKEASARVPLWMTETQTHLRSTVRALAKQALTLAERDANEGDTRLLVNEMLASAFGYDRFTELTTELMIRGEYVDYGITVNGQILAVVEVKRIGKKLIEDNLRQAESYALRSGVKWLVLTNGLVWRLYHARVTPVPALDLVFDVSLDDMSQDTLDNLFLLTRASLTRDEAEGVWERARATSPEAVRQVLASAPVITEIRREIHRQTGVRLSDDDTAAAVSSVLA